MRIILCALSTVAVLGATAAQAASDPAPAKSDKPAAGEKMKVYVLPICDKGAFRAESWDRDFGKVEFVKPDLLGSDEGTSHEGGKPCITEENLKKLKARQSDKLKVVDPRDEKH